MNDQTTVDVVTQRRAAQAIQRRGPELGLDPDLATARILAALAGGGALPEDGFRLLVERNRALADAPDEEVFDSLTRQSVLLEGLFLHFVARATEAATPDHAAGLNKAALNCQRSLLAVLGAIRSMSEAKRNSESVVVQ